MVLEIKQHIRLEGDNPLDARLTEKPFKVYLVAQFAIHQGIDEAVNHYEGLSLASIYAALSFYEDNKTLIEKAIEQERKSGYEMGAINSRDLIATIKKRKQPNDDSL